MVSADGAEHAARLETTQLSTSHRTFDSSITEDALQQKQRSNQPVVLNEAAETNGCEEPLRTTVNEKGIENSHSRVDDDDGANYVHGAARIALVFGLCVTTFLVGLDNLIIATAIPKITTLFHSLEDVGWYG